MLKHYSCHPSTLERFPATPPPSATLSSIHQPTMTSNLEPFGASKCLHAQIQPVPVSSTSNPSAVIKGVVCISNTACSYRITYLFYPHSTNPHNFKQMLNAFKTIRECSRLSTQLAQVGSPTSYDHVRHTILVKPSWLSRLLNNLHLFDFHALKILFSHGWKQIHYCPVTMGS